MCGIIGYVGNRRASEVLTEGLKRLEYRGYDSVGIAVLHGSELEIRKEKGMVEEVSSLLRFTALDGTASRLTRRFPRSEVAISAPSRAAMV